MLFVYKDKPADEDDKAFQLAQAASETPSNGKEGVVTDIRDHVNSALRQPDKLSDAENQRLKGKFRELFNRWFEEDEKREKWLTTKIEKVGQDMDYDAIPEMEQADEGAIEITEKVRPSDINLFMDELVSFVREKKADKKNESRLNAFTHFFASILESTECRLLEGMTFDYFFSKTVKATSDPFLQDWLGTSMAWKLSGRLDDVSKEQLDALAKQYSTLSIGDLLDAVHTCQTIGAIIYASKRDVEQFDGEDLSDIATDAYLFRNNEDMRKELEMRFEAKEREIKLTMEGLERAENNIKYLVQKISGINQTSFAHYAESLFLRRLKKEERYPSLDTIKNYDERDNPSHARPYDELGHKHQYESNKLALQIKPDIYHAPSDELLQISADYVALLDHSATPQFIGKFTAKKLQTLIEDINKTSLMFTDSDGHKIWKQKDDEKKKLYSLIREIPHQQAQAIIRSFAPVIEKFKQERESQMTKVHFEPYEDIPNDTLLNPFPSGDEKDIPLLLQQLHRPAMRKLVEDDLGIDFKEIPLASQIHLLRFMQDKDATMFKRLKDSLAKHPNSKQDILNTFFACSQNKEYGTVILDLIEKYPEKAERIFKQFNEIISIFQEEERKLKQKMEENEDLKGKVDMAKLYRTITKRGIRLLGEFAAKAKDIEDVEQYLEQAKAYNREVVAFGAMFKAASREDGQPVSPEVINQIAEDIKIETVQGGDLLEDTTREAMSDSANYKNPESFNHEHYQMIVKNLKKAYSTIDPGWLEHLIDHIPKDLSNPNVTFLLVKNKKNELAGVIKLKKVNDNEYYFGTMYVEEEYQQGFGIGQYLDAYMKQGLPEDATMEGTVAAANPAAGRHIDAVGYVGNSIVTEGDGKKRSRALINLDLNPQQAYKTKNKKEFSEDKIREYYETDSAPEGIEILLEDTSGGNVEVYTAKLEALFSQGYGLTRFFYAKVRDPKETYLVLERPEAKKGEQKLAA